MRMREILEAVEDVSSDDVFDVDGVLYWIQLRLDGGGFDEESIPTVDFGRLDDDGASAGRSYGNSASHALRVINTAFTIIKAWVRETRPQCLEIVASGQKRFRAYCSYLRKYGFDGYTWTTDPHNFEGPRIVLRRRENV